MLKITLKHLRSYGNDRYYPVCALSTMICELLGRKSLTKEQVSILEKHNYQILYMGKDKLDYKELYDELKEVKNERPS